MRKGHALRASRACAGTVHKFSKLESDWGFTTLMELGQASADFVQDGALTLKLVLRVQPASADAGEPQAGQVCTQSRARRCAALCHAVLGY